MTPLLYSFRRCPYAMRARMALAAAEIELRLREIVLRDKPAHMLELSPKGTVPVLQFADGTVLDESRDVMDWALAQADPHDWLAHKDDALIDLFDDDFKHHLDRYKYATRYEGADALEHRAACHKMLQDIELPLANGWLAGAAAGFTDIALLPFVRQFRIADADWFDNDMALPHVQAWVMRFLDWPVFTRIMGKYDLWLDSDKEHPCPPLS
ncbi:MAG: glutathione S-transferase [Alphaproteobacteria bacterium]|nr:glutathione S-transferase [Alphaproteobacteria bacterium]